MTIQNQNELSFLLIENGESGYGSNFYAARGSDHAIIMNDLKTDWQSRGTPSVQTFQRITAIGLLISCHFYSHEQGGSNST